MKIIFLALPLADVQLKKFIAERKKQGHLVIEIPPIPDLDTHAFIQNNLQQFKKDETLKPGTYDLEIYHPVAPPEMPLITFDENYTWRLHYHHSMDMLSSKFWFEERKKYANETIGRFFSNTLAYQNLSKTMSLASCHRKTLHQQRMFDLNETLFAKGIPYGSLKNAAIFKHSWGKHIAEIYNKNLLNLWVDPERQFHPNNQNEIYFRSFEFTPKNNFVLDYIRCFKPQKMNPPVPIEHCIPIDYPFDFIKELEIKGYRIISDSTALEKSTADHFLLVCPSEKEMDSILPIIQELGLIPTPSKMRDKIMEDGTTSYPYLQTKKPSKKILHINPMDLSDLLQSETFSNYQKLALKKNPEFPYISIFCTAIANMLLGLIGYTAKNSVDECLLRECYGYIFQYLQWTILYHKDHRRTNNISEWIIEEVLFILLILKPYQAGDFSKRMNEILKSYHGNVLDDNGLDFTIGLFNSGMRSFFEAMQAAFQTSSIQTIVYTNNSYFEVFKLSAAFPHIKQEVINYFYQHKSMNLEADIYVVNTVTIYDKDPYSIYAIDPQEFIEYLFSGRKSSKPCNILIDTTLMDKGSEIINGLLLLQKERIEKGILNLVFFESLQKFGMLGKDKVEAGFVWAANHPEKFAEFNKQITDPNRQNHQFDAQFMCHIITHAHTQLREAFLLSCNNGKLIRNTLPTVRNRIKHSDMSPFFYTKSNKKNDNRISQFCVLRGSFGFSDMVMTQYDHQPFIDTRIAAGYEGYNKLMSSLKCMSYKTTNTLKAINDLIMLLNIPGLTTPINANKLSLLSKVNTFLYQPELRSLFCENAPDIIKILKVVSDDFSYPKEKGLCDKERFFRELRYQAELLNFMNLILRFHDIPMPPEFTGRFHDIFFDLKNKVHYKTFKGIESLGIPISFLSVNNNNLVIDVEGLIKFKDALMKEKSDFSDLISIINEYHIIHRYSKLQKMPAAYLFTISFMRLLYANPSRTLIDLLAHRDNCSNPEEPISLPTVLLPNTVINGNHEVHIFFDELKDAIAFCKKNSLPIPVSGVIANTFIDIDKKYAKDPLIAKLYQRYVVKISISDYQKLVKNEESFLPQHEAYEIANLLDTLAMEPEWDEENLEENSMNLPLGRKL